MRTLRLPDGEAVPVLGQGTWRMGERAGQRGRRDRGAAARPRARPDADRHRRDVRRGRRRGAGRRGDRGPARRGVPGQQGLSAQRLARGHASPPASAACGGCGTDRLDLYLLHWRGAHPLAETVGGVRAAAAAPARSATGASATSTPTTWRSWRPCRAARAAPTNQVLYNLSRRGIEWDLLPWCRERGMPVMAYSPIEQGRLPTERRAGARSRRAPWRSPFQVALAWVLAQPGVLAIPKAARLEHVEANAAAARARRSPPRIWPRSTAQFPPPTGKRPLEML